MRVISPELVDHGGISAEEAAINSPGTPFFVAVVIAVSGFTSPAIAGRKFGRGRSAGTQRDDSWRRFRGADDGGSAERQLHVAL
jgi:hypothetical protein